jgi:hypothetical protein
MFRKGLFALLIVLLLAGAAIVAAQDDEHLTWVHTDYGWVRMIDDGRLNGFDIAAPVAVFYTYDTVRPPFADMPMTVTNGIQLLAIDPVTNQGVEVLRLTSEEILAAIGESGGGDVVLAQSNGYTLNYSPSGWYWVAAPADSEGKVYSFVWPDTVIPGPH